MSDYGVGQGLAAGVQQGLQMGENAYRDQLAGRKLQMEEEQHKWQADLAAEQIQKIKAGNRTVNAKAMSGMFSDPIMQEYAMQMATPFIDPNGDIRVEDMRGIQTKLFDPAHAPQILAGQLQIAASKKSQAEEQLKAIPQDGSPLSQELRARLQGRISDMDKYIATKKSVSVEWEKNRIAEEKIKNATGLSKSDDLIRRALIDRKRAAGDPNPVVTDNEVLTEKTNIKGKEKEQALKLQRESQRMMAELTPEQKKGLSFVSQDIINQRMTLDDAIKDLVQKMGGGLNASDARNMIYTRVKEEYPDFDFQKAEANKRSMYNQEFIRQENTINRVMESAALAKDYIKALNDPNNPSNNTYINKFRNWWRTNMEGTPEPTNWQTLATALSQEFNLAYSGSRQTHQGRFDKEFANLDAAKSPEILTNSIATNLRILKTVKDSVTKMRQPYTKDEVLGQRNGSYGEQEGLSSGSKLQNNPFGIKVGGQTQKWIDSGAGSVGPKAKDGGNFINFKTKEDAIKATHDLLFMSPVYKDLTVDGALKKWSNNGYSGDIVPALKGVKVKDLSREQQLSVLAAMYKGETGKTANPQDLQNGGNKRQVGRFVVEEG